MYSDENLNILYEDYKCKSNHYLQWTGADYISTSYLVCQDCKQTCLNDPNRAIRWHCSKCNEYFCQKCRPISMYFQCPNYHTFTINNASANLNYSNFTCDRCYAVDSDVKNIFIDKICNVTFCKNCVSDKESFIYYVRED